MIPKKLAPAKAGVADFSDKIMRKIKENRERCRFKIIEKRSKVAVSLRLTRKMVERFKADGPGWQTRMDKALKKAAGLQRSRRLVPPAACLISP